MQPVSAKLLIALLRVGAVTAFWLALMVLSFVGYSTHPLIVVAAFLLTWATVAIANAAHRRPRDAPPDHRPDRRG